MKIYLIGYDLNKTGQNYKTLIDKIETFGIRWHHLDSTWIVKSDQTAAQIRDLLKPLIDSNDELLVVQLSNGNAAWTTGFSNEASNWLFKYLS
jgi:hypothetical protein